MGNRFIFSVIFHNQRNSHLDYSAFSNVITLVIPVDDGDNVLGMEAEAMADDWCCFLFGIRYGSKEFNKPSWTNSSDNTLWKDSPTVQVLK